MTMIRYNTVYDATDEFNANWKTECGHSSA